jgi:hypothetical protein
MHSLILSLFVQESQEGAFQLVHPGDELHEKKRQIRLLQAGVLTIRNVPHLAHVTCPPFDDPGWGYLNREQLDGMNMQSIYEDYVTMFYNINSEGNEHRHKSQMKFVSRRVYDCKVLHQNEFMFFVFKVDRSQRKDRTSHVLLVFKGAVGRDASALLQFLRGKCDADCTAGA